MILLYVLEVKITVVNKSARSTTVGEYLQSPTRQMIRAYKMPMPTADGWKFVPCYYC